MSAAPLAQVVDSFAASHLTVRVVRGLMSVLPFAPAWTHPGTLEEQAGGPREAELAEAWASREGAVRALQVFDLIDKADTGIAVFSGVRGAVKAVRGEDGAWEVDPQQGADAALKALGVAWAAYALFNGDVARINQSKAGRALLAWFAAADLVLPFADNAAEGGVALFTGTLDKYTPAAAEKLAALGGPSVSDATGALAQIRDQVGTFAAQATLAAGPVSEWAKSSLPGALGLADKATGALATVLDTLAAYRYLGSALVAELAVAEAKVQAAAERAAAAEAAEQARVEAERKAEADRLAAEAEAKASAERAAAEAKAKAEKEAAEAEAKRAASAVREDYSLDKAEAAASLQTTGIKVTRGAEIEAAAGKPVAKAGCLGCGSVFLLAGLFGAAAGAAMWV